MKIIFLLLLLLIMSPSTHATVYKCVKAGQTSYSNDRCPNADIVATSSNKENIEEDNCSATQIGLPNNKKRNDGAELHVIGVYEGPIHRGGNPLANKVNVHVLSTERPIILALFNYESVVWNITINKGASVREIIINSSDGTQLSGINEKVVKVTRQNIGYTAYDKCTFNSAVASKIQEFSGHDVQSFQGAYKGLEFAIQVRNKENKQITVPVEKGASHKKADIVPAKSQLLRPSLADEGRTGVLFKLGMEAFQNEQYTEAAKLFKKAIAKEPRASAPWYFLGDSLVKSGNTDEAQCAFAKALVLPQNGPDANQIQSEPIVERMRELSAKYQPPKASQCNHLDKEIAQLADSDPRSLQDRLKSCDPQVAVAAAEEVISKQATLKDPLLLFTAAATLFQHGKKDEAVFWFYVAQLRTRYQLVFENGDRGQLLAIMLMTVGAPINNYAFQNVGNFRRILDRVLEWDKTAPNSFRERSHSEAEEQKIAAVYAGMHDLRVKIVAEQADLEAKARKAAPEIESMYAAKNNPQCRAGQVDPSNAAKETAKEKILVSDYVRINPEVIQDAGEIKNTWVETFSTKSTDTMPSRYEVGVISSVGKESHAIVDVSRSGSDVKFKLLCIARKRWVLRDPTKDPCNQ